MNKYEELAEMLLRESTKNLSEENSIVLNMDDAVKIYNALMGMSRILKIAESDYGGAELFR